MEKMEVSKTRAYINAVVVNVVICINYVHSTNPLFCKIQKSISSSSHSLFILCYNVICDFAFLIFALTRVRKTL